MAVQDKTSALRKDLNILRSVFNPPENIIILISSMKENSKINPFAFNEIVISKFHLSVVTIVIQLKKSKSKLHLKKKS